MKRTYSTRLITAIRTAAKPSDYIEHITELKPGPVVLYLRVSGRGQREHLEHQEKNLMGHLTKRGFKVVTVVKEIVPGWAETRIGLERAAVIAKDEGAVVVAESGCRFLRSSSFKRDKNGKRRINQNASPTIYEMKGLMGLVDGARLATLLPPDTHWTQVRGEQSKRGQAGTGHKGGRGHRSPGWTKKRRELTLAEVLELREDGLSLRKIGQWVRAPWSTIRDWTQRGSA